MMLKLLRWTEIDITVLDYNDNAPVMAAPLTSTVTVSEVCCWHSEYIAHLHSITISLKICFHILIYTIDMFHSIRNFQ